jgi:hypothetical protein
VGSFPENEPTGGGVFGGKRDAERDYAQLMETWVEGSARSGDRRTTRGEWMRRRHASRMPYNSEIDLGARRQLAEIALARGGFLIDVSARRDGKEGRQEWKRSLVQTVTWMWIGRS